MADSDTVDDESITFSYGGFVRNMRSKCILNKFPTQRVNNLSSEHIRSHEYAYPDSSVNVVLDSGGYPGLPLSKTITTMMDRTGNQC